MSVRPGKSRRDFLVMLEVDKTKSRRNRLGQYSTSYELALHIVRRAVALLPPDANIRFLEPGFGTGTFYSALMDSPFAKNVRFAAGYEIDPAYGKAAQRLWDDADLQLHIADFTQIDPPITQEEKFNLIVCNPPYVRHHHLSVSQKKFLRSRVAQLTGIKVTGLSGLYVYFLLISKAWMTEGGVGAWLIPSEFMDVNYGRAVKQFLLEKVTLHEIHRFRPDEIQFEDALVSSTVVFFTNLPPKKKHKIRFSFGGELKQPQLVKVVNSEYLRKLPKWTVLAEKNSSHLLIAHNKTLSDLFTIKRGVATGANRFFILTPEKIEEYEIPKEFLIPILPSPRDLETNEVRADEHGNPILRKRLFLLACDWQEEDIRLNYPALWRYFESGIIEGIPNRYLCRHRSPWYSQEVRPPAPLLCTYMGRKGKDGDSPFRVILNRSKAIAPNVYLMLYPKQPLAHVFERKPKLLKQVWKALTGMTTEMLVRYGRVYGGGLHKLEPKELGRVPADALIEALARETEFNSGQLRLFGYSGLT